MKYRVFCCFLFSLVFSLNAFTQDDSNWEVINPDDFLPGTIDPSDDVTGVLGLEFGMTSDEVIETMTRQGCTLAYKNIDEMNNIILIGFDGYTYEEIPDVRVSVNLFEDRDYLYVVMITLYYGDKVSREKVREINEANIQRFGVTLYNVQEVVQQGFLSSWTEKVSEYYIMRTDESGKILYGKFLYQFSESENTCSFSFWGFD